MPVPFTLIGRKDLLDTVMGTRPFHQLNGKTTVILAPSQATSLTRISCSLPAVFGRVLANLQQAAPEPDGDRMRPIVRLELVHQIFYMKIDRVFRDRELIGNLFVAVAVTYKP
jgi:hypothetical protein